ncbi:MAG: hypothetical protein OXC19_08735 [Bryobacterales bacterium]|nr:hypothetical protein [Bryobacterales bacterium]
MRRFSGSSPNPNDLYGAPRVSPDYCGREIPGYCEGLAVALIWVNALAEGTPSRSPFHDRMVCESIRTVSSEVDGPDHELGLAAFCGRPTPIDGYYDNA